jgi:putative AlgH/UPF0301 family transcriptional regulator
MMLRLLIITSCAVINQAFTITSPFHTSPSPSTLSTRTSTCSNDRTSFTVSDKHTKLLLSRRENNDEADDEDGDIDVSDLDWRAFRAQLVMDSTSTGQTSQKEEDSSSSIIVDDDLDGIGSLFNDDKKDTPMTTENFTPLNPSQWAYDSGNVIEKGAVILGGVEQDYGFGLRQQYFHKAVILVLEHDSKFTKGIILNRPSDLILVDEKDEESGLEMKWRVWFGGDVQGLDYIYPEVICLHSISTGDEKVEEVSTTIMNDIQWTSFDDAKMLVREGLAKTSDFWVFAGYAGWGPEQLMGELERKSWYMCATDSQTLLKELANQSALTDPRDAGLDTWELLMNLIGRGETVEESSGDFEDLMLKEWARENLLSIEAGGNAGIRMQPAEVASTKPLVSAEPVDDFMQKARDSIIKQKVSPGTLVRAGSNDRSPFLLEKQEFHKSIVLIIAEDENLTIGIILNHPSTKAVEMELIDKVTGAKRELQIPIRFGGMYSIQGQSPLFWMHLNPKLRDAEIGSPVGPGSDVWKCTQNEATGAINQGVARPSDFIIATGLSVWTKNTPGNDGIQGEIRNGNFEVIPSSKYSTVWEKLRSQKDVLTKINLIKHISNGGEAWKSGATASSENATDTDDVVTEGIGEGFDEENDIYVHNSDVRVAKLSDDALRSWVATFLLGAPTLGA